MTARFSEDRRYRWLLSRTWDPAKPAIAFVMLNPSKADEYDNDPTVERCQRRARMTGFGTLRVANIFALVSTDPDELLLYDDPIGKWNDDAILEAAGISQLVVCAWGSHRSIKTRGKDVLQLIRSAGRVPHALGINRDGNPVHPLYQPYTRLPAPIPEETTA